MKEVVKYKCDWCGKDYANKSYCLKHEEGCFFNPKTKSCVTCNHLFKASVDRDRFCKNDLDIKRKLKTNCKSYVEIDHDQDYYERHPDLKKVEASESKKLTELTSKFIKIKIKSVEESESVQNKAFELGLSWPEKGRKIIHMDANSLYMDFKNMWVTCGYCLDLFNYNEGKEISVEDWVLK